MSWDQPESLNVAPIKPEKGMNQEKIDKWEKDLIAEMRQAYTAMENTRVPEWKTSVAQYNGRLKPEDNGPQDADMDYTISFELAEQAKARVVNPLMGYSQIFYPKERGKDFYDIAVSQAKYTDWLADQTDWLTLFDDWVSQAQVFGAGWVKTTFERQTQDLLYWDEEGKLQTQSVDLHHGARSRVAHTPNMLYPENCGEDINEVRWIAERYYQDMSEVRRLEGEGIYYKDFSKTLSDSKGPDHELALGGGFEKEEGGDDAKQVELWEVYTKAPNGKEAIVTVNMKDEKCGRKVYNWHHSHARPYISWGWKKRSGTLDATSLMQLLEGGHKAYQAIMNMTMDSGSRAIEKIVLADEALELSEYFKDGKLITGFVEVSNVMGDSLKTGIREISLSDGVTSLQWLLDRVVKHMHNVASIPEAFFGEEVAERPTATGTTEVLTEARQPLSFMLERFRRKAADVFEMQYARMRQFFPEGMEYYTMAQDEEEQERIWEVMKWPEGIWQEQVAFETMCSSQQMSRDVRRKHLMALVEQVPAALGSVLEFAGPAVEGSPMAPIAAQAAKIQAGVVQQFMNEFEVQGAEDFDIEGSINIGQKIQEMGQQLQQFQQQVQAQAGQLQQLRAENQYLKGGPAGQGGPQLAGGPQGPPGMGPPPPQIGG